MKRKERKTKNSDKAKDEIIMMQTVLNAKKIIVKIIIIVIIVIMMMTLMIKIKIRLKKQ